MALCLGVQPAAGGKFTTSALWAGAQLPAVVFSSRRLDSVDAAVGHILGLAYDWGGVAAIAIAAPLTWSGRAKGWRTCDAKLSDRIPARAPKTAAVRAPTRLPGAMALQGPALAWALAREVGAKTLAPHLLVEATPRTSALHVLDHCPEAVAGYRNPLLRAAAHRSCVADLLRGLTAPGIVQLDRVGLETADGLDALLAALTALAVSRQELGLVVETWPGGDLEPVGSPPVALLKALP